MKIKILLLCFSSILSTSLFGQFIEMTPAGGLIERDSSASLTLKSRIGSNSSTLTKINLDASFVGIGGGQAKTEINFDLSGQNNFKISNVSGQAGSFPFTSNFSYLAFNNELGELGRFNKDFFRVQKMGIGTDPWHPLSFSSSFGDKVSLSGVSLTCILNACTTDSTHYGFGYQSNKLQIITKNSSGDVVIGYGKSYGFTENVRFKGNGKVGIGTDNPSEKLHVVGKIISDSLAGSGTRSVYALSNGTLSTLSPLKIYSLAPADFSPEVDLNEAYDRFGTYGEGSLPSGSNNALIAPIHLPDNAIIESITFYYINSQNTRKFHLSLYNSAFTAGFSNIIVDGSSSVLTTINTVASNSLSVTSPIAINNSDNNYLLRLVVRNSSNVSSSWLSGMGLKGVKIEYRE